MRSVLKHNVPVDGRWHRVPLREHPAAIALAQCQYGPESVQFWCEEDASADAKVYEFRVFGTGEHIDDDDAKHVTSCHYRAATASLVWHLYVRPVR